MARITGTIDLSSIPEADMQPDQHLRVAVAREGSILASTVLAVGKERKLRFDLDFDPPFLPGARFPCPVILLVGPNVADADLHGLETVRREVELVRARQEAPPVKGGSQEAGAEAKRVDVGTVDVGVLTLEPAIYRFWWLTCRTYTITGRVVCRKWDYDPATGRWGWCDEPVPGATVEALDVDCFFWWCRRDQITTATTAVDGTFTMTFTWCCRRWFPWLVGGWAIDDDLLRRIRELLAQARIPLPPFPPGPDPDPTFVQQLLGTATSLPGALAASGRGAPMDLSASLAGPVSADALQALLPRSPELEALHVWPWWPWRDCAPDVVFRVTQPCNGTVNVIYSEPHSATRWNIPTSLGVTLVANNLACCLPTCRDPECPECLKLSWIGCTPVNLIGASAGPPDVRGYANAATQGDNPFYGALGVRGGVGWDVDYFKVQYSFNGGAWTDLPDPTFAGFGRSYWDGTTNIPVAFNTTVKSGQRVIITRRHFEDINPAIPRFGGQVMWNDYDTLFVFDTLAAPAVTPDGLYQLRFVGYSADAAENLLLNTERILPTCGQLAAESVYLRIDNRAMNHPASTPSHPCTLIHACTDEPDCFIRDICKNEGQPGEVCGITGCDIVSLNPNDTLTIHFTVSVPTTVKDGHLGGYWLRAEYGVSQVFYIGTGAPGVFQEDPPLPTVQVGPSYADALAQGAPRPLWYGGNYKVTLKATDFPECCAYLLRLWAWKRTTNGCADPSVVHYNQFEVAFTVLRPELCPGICPE